MVNRRFHGANGGLRNAINGYTLIELLVVLAVLAILASLVVPRYLDRVEEARETVLRQNLVGLRTAIDQFYRDKARYPETLEELVTKRYIRAIPVDPITQRMDSWVGVSPSGGAVAAVVKTINASPNLENSTPGAGALFDVKSGAVGRSRDGSEYATW